MFKKLKEIRTKLSLKIIGAASAASAFIIASPAGVFAGAIANAGEKAQDGIVKEAQAFLPYLLSIVFVIVGVMLIALGQRGKESAKQQAPQVIIGIACIMFAVSIGSLLVGWFK